MNISPESIPKMAGQDPLQSEHSKHKNQKRDDAEASVVKSDHAGSSSQILASIGDIQIPDSANMHCETAEAKLGQKSSQFKFVVRC